MAKRRETPPEYPYRMVSRGRRSLTPPSPERIRRPTRGKVGSNHPMRGQNPSGGRFLGRARRSPPPPNAGRTVRHGARLDRVATHDPHDASRHHARRTLGVTEGEPRAMPRPARTHPRRLRTAAPREHPRAFQRFVDGVAGGEKPAPLPDGRPSGSRGPVRGGYRLPGGREIRDRPEPEPRPL